MPPLTRRFLGTAALFLTLGLALGFVLLWRREIQGVWPPPYLVTAHVHLVLVGAVLELILGTAWWLFPRPARGDPRNRPGLMVAAWWLVTLGTAFRALGEAARSAGGRPGPAWLILLAGTAQGLGLIAGVVALRPRVRAMGTGLRSAD